MTQTDQALFRSVREELFPQGTVIEGKPAPEVLYPDFEPRMLPSGKTRPADVELSKDRLWIKTGGGTSLFDREDVFRGQGWLAFIIPLGTEIPASLKIRHTGFNKTFAANHHLIESATDLMPVDSYKGALDNLARNAIVRSVQLAQRRQ